MLHIMTWWWGNKYGDAYVQRLSRGLKRHMRKPFRFACVTDRPRAVAIEQIRVDYEDAHLLERGCFARLRMFDPKWQTENKILPGEPLVCIDLDVIITGRFDELFERRESFVILYGANAVNPCPYNGSLWMLKAGTHAEVWRDFTLERAAKVPFHEFPDDQGWMWHKIPDAGKWEVGKPSGIWAFRKKGWPSYDRLPSECRIVCFPGNRDPGQFTHLPWVIEHWR